MAQNYDLKEKWEMSLAFGYLGFLPWVSETSNIFLKPSEFVPSNLFLCPGLHICFPGMRWQTVFVPPMNRMIVASGRAQVPLIDLARIVVFQSNGI